MKVYQLTEAEKREMLTALKLSNYNPPEGNRLPKAERKAQERAVKSLHRWFTYLVRKALD